jgi:hypothetical protein
MIKGEVEELTLMMEPEEVKALVKQYNDKAIINIMGKRYAIRGADCTSGVRHYSGEYRTRVTIKIQAIKKGG